LEADVQRNEGTSPLTEADHSETQSSDESKPREAVTKAGLLGLLKANKPAETATTFAPTPSSDECVLKALDWASALSAEERGWVDETYRPPAEVMQLVERLKRTNRSFQVLTGLWGVGKSSALQHIYLCLGEGDRKSVNYLIRLLPSESLLNQIRSAAREQSSQYDERRRSAYIDEIDALWDTNSTFRKHYESLGLSMHDIRTSIEKGDRNLDSIVLPAAAISRAEEEALLGCLTEDVDALLLDLPDFGRSDRRLFLRTLNEIQDVWVSIMKSGAEHSDIPIGMNVVITIQKELSDLAPSYFLGKANTVEIKPLSASELVDAYRAKFPTLEPFDESSLSFVAELSRGIFRRFLKFIAVTLQDAHQRGANHVHIQDVTWLLDATLVGHEMEPELASIFPKAEVREKAFRIIYELLATKAMKPLVKDHSSGPVSQKRLAEALSLTESDMSRIVDRLVANRIVSRERTDEGNILHLA
jgi:hypothetical protein